MKETKWNIIKSMLDGCFKNMINNLWTVVWHIMSYAKFKNTLKTKYWSKSIQNMIRNGICNGRYDPNWGQKFKAYSLGKELCLTRNLEAKVPKKSLITKLVYHFKETISRARLRGQVKTIQGMEAV